MTISDEIKTLAESILDQTIDIDLFYNLVNISKDTREGLRSFLFLNKLNSANAATTSPITLPTDFRIEKTIMIGDQTIYPIPFNKQHLYRNASGKYFIDYAGMTLNLLAPSSGTVYIYYSKTTPVITSAVTPVWRADFWPLLAYDVVVAIQAGQDADSEFARMAIENNRKADLIWKSMVADDNLKQIKAQGGRIGVQDSEPNLELGNM